ncbi:amidase [Lysobacter sp. CFH 32150]|uniref:amidase n=1 Tax=Lysobacter sp. CFH 32150 TaxID=2927128 RepID=UPI001FA70AB9|nr:amidase [Lysobacter sp. CFH 32150]MCI4569257.1 amidase [Lysobacter sp. CFH 32150]
MRHALLAVALITLCACDRTTAPAPGTPAAPESTTSRKANGFAYAEADITGLQSRMARGELSSHQLTQAYLDRIAAIDKAGPMLNSVIELNPDALKDADARDAERKAGRVRSPLHGIPVLLKDNIDATPMVNSAGSLALAANRPKRDAFLVARLREAGAVILGKTNLSEWANFRSTRSTSGWSGRGGQTKNPYVLDRNPCGSSSGTGTAIAADLATVGIGTETDGSIICPASVAGLVGLKPTVGLVSRDGIIPISSSQDTAGPMTRSVADAAVLLAAIAGRDDADAVTSSSVGRAVFDYPMHLKADGLKGARIGVLRKSMGFHPDVDAAMEKAIVAMKAAGATVVDAEIATAGQWDAPELEVLLYEFKAGLERYLASHDAPVRTLAQLIAWNKLHAKEEMPYFAQELFEKAEAKGPLGDPAYLDARSLSRRLAGEQGIDATLQAQQLDALIAPSMSPAWLTDPVLGDHFVGAGYGAAAVAGYPSLSVPMGDSHGTPLGIVFMGPAWSEPRLIELGYAFEQLTKSRKPPQFLPTLELAVPVAQAK